jgi:DNA-binding NarL/FixJ family response regulator
MIRVAICDDHQIVRVGFRQILKGVPDIEVVAEAATGRDALDLARKKLCDVMLLDIAMPDQNGVDALRAIKQGQPEMPILMLSGYPAEQYAVNLLKAGANGYLNKECAPEELLTAIRTVAQGRRYVNAQVGELLAQGLDHKLEGAPHTGLSDREFQIFLHLARGESVSGIAEKLSLSVKTISTYRTRVMEKMALSSNSDLTYYALKNGLME